jgi:hypothetical protein
MYACDLRRDERRRCDALAQYVRGRRGIETEKDRSVCRFYANNAMT